MGGDEGTRGSVSSYVAAPPVYLRERTRFLDSPPTDSRIRRRAFVLLLVTALGLVVIPEAINYLIVKHTPDLAISEALVSAETPVAGLARWVGSAALLAVSAWGVLMRGHPNRDITWLLVFLLALNLPYLAGPDRPGPADLVKILLANIVLLAIWNTGARVADLKWIPVLMSCVGAYSIVGGLIIPEYMMYNIVSRKSLVAGWELAGPFGQSNALGMYCAISFSLIPLIKKIQWRVLCASLLLATIILSATRTAVVAAAVVILWWIFCRIRPLISVRLAGTALATSAVAAAFVIPWLDWGSDAFTERAFIWSEALDLWQQAPIVGSGFNWFLVHGQAQAQIVVWAVAGTGHNIVVDTLVKYGVVGLATLIPVWLGAIWATRAMRAPNEQIACFGYLSAFFVMAITEAVWDLWPNVQQFPTSGLIFATILMARNGDPARQESPDVEKPKSTIEHPRAVFRLPLPAHQSRLGVRQGRSGYRQLRER
ncbi:O-antigen ligase family protein [Mycobacterium sp. ITM-2016-00317]|uniref:O-antigen ligase family protein n=1 Tax=Mycobacterium sp. ITM-2016-00317 TaxID=2099694 RepID=UPI00287FAF81|nr:O-antigen ligase family protein [Mycobacterium sp. ITM-2016-00317]WNG87012.1 O-antigen ligase family protein [Mycobacterium sp. ITM-2016-00317]